jgi:hypothetical protein
VLALADNGAMTNQALIPDDIAARYEVHEWRNGLAILAAAHPNEWRDILEVLRDFVLLKSDVLKPGGHKVDCYKSRVALEVEWNNKDPFFDRDLNNFRLLFDLRAIDAGVIITRCTELQQIFNQLGRGPSFGNSTTHMAKLLPRLDGGSGGGCPVVVFGIRGACYVED